jgi:hypothetical protein
MTCRSKEDKLTSPPNLDPIAANKLRTKRVEFEQALSKGDEKSIENKLEALLIEINSVEIGGLDEKGWKNGPGGVEKKYETQH